MKKSIAALIFVLTIMFPIFWVDAQLVSVTDTVSHSLFGGLKERSVEVDEQPVKVQDLDNRDVCPTPEQMKRLREYHGLTKRLGLTNCGY